MKQNDKLPLPIDQYLEQILKDGQIHSTLLIKASPGSGKTTRLPWAMTHNSPGQILVLEPRRLAAKMAATRIAQEQSLTLGKEVGYHFRFEKNYSPETRLIFYTEGTFLKRLLHDPDLRNVSMVVLDEFHERHIETDVALSALRSLQERRKDFKLVLMSATLDTKVYDYFSDAKTIEIEAPRFKVDLSYLPNQPSILNQSLESKIRKTLETTEHVGDVLVFVPGKREMLKVREHLGSHFGDVFLLHADLEKDEQEKALLPHSNRKIILSTNIAESSVTIPGITMVIDSGIQREASFSPWSGLKSLVDRPITQSSAIQRAGRAGRTSPGVCFRLYAEHDFNERAAHTIPEIMRADLTDTVLLTSEFNYELMWFTPPPFERWQKAMELSKLIGALNEAGELTEVGRKMQGYPLDARLSRALVAGEKLPLSEKRRLLKFICEEIEHDQYGVMFKRLQFFLKDEGTLTQSFEQALLTGFIDQVARLRIKQHDFIHFSGKTLKIHKDLKDLHHDYYIILDVTPRQEAFSVLAIDEDWPLEIEPFPFHEESLLDISEKFSAKLQTKLGSLVMDERNTTLTWENTKHEIKEKIFFLAAKTFKDKLAQWREDDKYLRYHYWAKLSKLDLDEVLDKLTPRMYFEEFENFSWEPLTLFFESKLEIKNLDSNLPAKIDLGGKRELKIFYPLNMDPYVEAPIQDFYGQKTTPTIMNGKIPLTLKLLGPQKMPIQVTKDLVGFWQRTYPVMKKEWSRDYPRHHWPDDPATAKPVLLKRML